MVVIDVLKAPRHLALPGITNDKGRGLRSHALGRVGRGLRTPSRLTSCASRSPLYFIWTFGQTQKQIRRLFYSKIDGLYIHTLHSQSNRQAMDSPPPLQEGLPGRQQRRRRVCPGAGLEQSRGDESQRSCSRGSCKRRLAVLLAVVLAAATTAQSARAQEVAPLSLSTEAPIPLTSTPSTPVTSADDRLDVAFMYAGDDAGRIAAFQSAVVMLLEPLGECGAALFFRGGKGVGWRYVFIHICMSFSAISVEALPIIPLPVKAAEGAAAAGAAGVRRRRRHRRMPSLLDLGRGEAGGPLKLTGNQQEQQQQQAGVTFSTACVDESIPKVFIQKYKHTLKFTTYAWRQPLPLSLS